MAMLEIQNIHKSFRTYDEKPHFHIGPFPRGHARRVIRTLDVLRGVDLTVEKGDVVAILGPSGSGKTTLLRCLNFLEPTDSGSLTFDGETFDLSRISGADIARLRKKTAFVFQNYNLFRNKTALQNVTEGLVVARKMPKAEADAIGRKMLEENPASTGSLGTAISEAVERALNVPGNKGRYQLGSVLNQVALHQSIIGLESKIVYLTLWIISLIVLAVYLICVEYIHDKTSRQLSYIHLSEEEFLKKVKEGKDE